MLHQAVTFWRIMGCQICGNSLGSCSVSCMTFSVHKIHIEMIYFLTDMIGIAKLELEFALVIVHYFKPHIYIKSVWVEALICIWPPGLMKIKDFLDWTLIYWFHLFFQCGNFCKWIFKRNCRDIYILAWFIEFDLNVHGLLSPSSVVIESRFLFFYTFYDVESLKVALKFT